MWHRTFSPHTRGKQIAVSQQLHHVPRVLAKRSTSTACMESGKGFQEPSPVLEPAVHGDNSEQQPPPFILRLCSIPWRFPAAFQSIESIWNTLAADLCPFTSMFWRVMTLCLQTRCSQMLSPGCGKEKAKVTALAFVNSLQHLPAIFAPSYLPS